MEKPNGRKDETEWQLSPRRKTRRVSGEEEQDQEDTGSGTAFEKTCGTTFGDGGILQVGELSARFSLCSESRDQGSSASQTVRKKAGAN